MYLFLLCLIKSDFLIFLVDCAVYIFSIRVFEYIKIFKIVIQRWFICVFKYIKVISFLRKSKSISKFMFSSYARITVNVKGVALFVFYALLPRLFRFRNVDGWISLRRVYIWFGLPLFESHCFVKLFAFLIELDLLHDSCFIFVHLLDTCVHWQRCAVHRVHQLGPDRWVGLALRHDSVKLNAGLLLPPRDHLQTSHQPLLRHLQCIHLHGCLAHTR